MQETDRTSNRERSYTLQHADSNEHAGKRTFVEPKLTFVTPKLVKHGRLETETQSFFGPFSP